jgi:hypothetical protein
MILMVVHEHNGGLVIGKEGKGIWERAKDFEEEALEPEPLLYPMHGCNVLTLYSGEGDNLLVLGWPGDSAAVDEKCIARYGLLVLSHGAISVCIAFKDMPCLTIWQAEVTCAGQVVEDLLDGLLIHRPGVCAKTCHCHNSEHDIWVYGECGLVKCTNGLAVWHIAHCSELGGGQRCLLWGEADLYVHRHWDWLDVGEVVVAKDRVDVRVLGDRDGLGLTVMPHLDAKHPVQFAEVSDLNVVA